MSKYDFVKNGEKFYILSFHFCVFKSDNLKIKAVTMMMMIA